jgi:hypothetical protein
MVQRREMMVKARCLRAVYRYAYRRQKERQREAKAEKYRKRVLMSKGIEGL